MNQLEDCLAYFRENPVFGRLLQGFWRKYASYGRFEGSVQVTFRDREERESLEGFLQKNFQGRKKTSVSARLFTKALAESRFTGVEPEAILEAWFGALPQTRASQRGEKKEAWQRFFRKQLTETEDELACSWLTGILEENPKTEPSRRVFLREWNRAWETGRRDTFEDGVRLACRILENLPIRQEQYLPLPVFAARLTGDPHAFDRGRADSGLLNCMLAWCQERKGIQADLPDQASLVRQQRLLTGGLLVDEMSNGVLVYGLEAFGEDGAAHPGMAGFLQTQEALQVPLGVLVRWKRVRCFGEEAFIVENPSLFARLCKGRRTVLCFNGQPRLAAIFLLKLLEREKIHVRYGGDLDPEGLQIAQNLKQLYDGPFSFWHMDLEDYRSSHPRVAISERRLKILERIREPELLATAEAIRKKKKAGYQENIPAFWNRPEK